jgi:putative ABC transport system permease protein
MEMECLLKYGGDAYFMASLMTITQNLPEMFFVGWTFLEYTAVILLAYVVSQYILSLIFARTKPSEIIRGLGGEI